MGATQIENWRLSVWASALQGASGRLGKVLAGGLTDEEARMVVAEATGVIGYIAAQLAARTEGEQP